MVTVYTLTYNEELLIQFMIDHYRARFPGCRIVVYDNMSTDDTVKIALANGCEVVPFNTNNQYQEGRQIEIRSFGEVADEYNQADLVFLMPWQMEMLPQKSFDLIYAVDSLSEMNPDLIAFYFKM